MTSTTGTQRLRYRNSNGTPGQLVFGALAWGHVPGTIVGSVTIPLNNDSLFQVSLGGLPGISTGFLTTLDVNREVAATLGPMPAAALGATFYCGFATLDLSAPQFITHVSNAVACHVR